MSKKVITFYDSETQAHDFPIITPDYGICSTESNTSAKVVTCDDFSLITGAEITVKFTNTPTTDTITLNVNNSGAKNVDFSACGNKPYDEIKANGCYGFVYDGTSWIYKGSGKGASKEELERIKYYGDPDIIPSPESYFTVNETGETITGLTNTGKRQTKLVIPYEIDGVKITDLATTDTSILDGNSVITKVVIPNSVINIAEGAFKNCTSLTSINIPNSVTSIDFNTFQGCTALISFNIPNSVTSIWSGAFSDCTSLTSVNIPDSVTSIDHNVFYGCTSLTSVNIPNSITSISGSTFKNCTSLRSVNIPNGIMSISNNAFEGCTSLTSINIPDSVTIIDQYAFSGCTALTSITIPNSVTDIGYDVFAYSENVKIYCEPGSYAETYATENNISVMYTDISKIVIENKADKQNSNGGFSGGEGSSSTYGGAIGAHAEATDGGAVGAGAAASAGGGAIGMGATSESGGAVGLAADSSGGGAIGFEARTSNGFAGGKSAQTIDANENPIDAIQLGSGINYAPKSFQVYTYQMMSADGTIPADRLVNAPKTEVVNDLESDDTTKALSAAQGKVLALADERLKYYGDKDIIPSSESWFTVNETGESITGLTDEGKTQTELVIPYEINGKKITKLYSGVTGTSILDGNNVITKVVIPNSVTNIEGFAFFSCSSLTSIDIPNSVTSIGDVAFASCTSLTSINIPNSVTIIGGETFKGCTSLTSINIPNSVTSIGYGAFWGCTSLTSIDIPNSVTSIGDSAFDSCLSLTSIDIPNSVTSIGDSAFYGCASNFTIYCEQGSYAETYAKANNIPIVYTNISDNSINKITELEKLIDNLHYYCNKNIVINTTCFYTEQNEEGTGNFVLNTDNLTNTTLVIPYTLYSEYWTNIEGITMTNCNITGSLNVEKIIIPRGMEFKNPLTSEVWTDELLITLLPNLKTIVRIHEDGAVISYNIAEKSIN